MTKTRGPWIEGRCVLGPWRHSGKDKNPSFAIRVDSKNKSICKCLSCGFGGDLMDLLFTVRDYLNKSPAQGYNLQKASELISNEFDDLEFSGHDIPDFDEGIKKKETAFPEHWLTLYDPAWKHVCAVNYLQSRNISAQVSKELDIRYDPTRKRVGFPFRNAAGKLMGMQGRAIDKSNELRYYQYGYQDVRNTHVWMGENRLNLDLPVVLCEGPFDLARIYASYKNVAASFTSGLSVEKLKRLSDASEIITFYDHGKGGDAAREKIKDVLKGRVIHDIIPTAAEEDAGAMPDQSIRGYLNPYVPLVSMACW